VLCLIGQALPPQRLGEIEVRRRIASQLSRSGSKLGDRSIQISSIQQASSRVGREDRRLQSICAFRHLRSQLALGGRAFCISELAQNSSEGGVGAGKIGLKADGLAKSIGSFL